MSALVSSFDLQRLAFNKQKKGFVLCSQPEKEFKG